MILRSLETRSFRNLEDSEVTLHPAVNVFVGDNGAGKTNFLEAVHFLATTKSFRSARAAALPRFESSNLFVAGSLEREQLVRRLSVGLELTPQRRRELLVNQQPVTLAAFLPSIQLFAYASSRLEIVRGGPEERRRFLDRGIASLDPGYLGATTRYGRVLKQRNALLQEISAGRAAARQLDPWDEELLLAAWPLIEARRVYAARLQGQFDAVAGEHRYHLRGLRLRYEPSHLIGDPERDRRELAMLRRRETGAGFTLAGPHRDHLEIETLERPAAEVLSGGELKMVVLFLKLAKVELYYAATGERPLLVLDDLDAELDPSILERLVRHLTSRSQLFTSSPKEEFVSRLPFGAHRRYMVRNGKVEEAEDRMK